MFPRSDTEGSGGRKMSSRFSEPMKMNWKRPEYAEEEEEPSGKANGVKDSPPTRKSHVILL